MTIFMPHLPDLDPPFVDRWDANWFDREFDLFGLGDAMSSAYDDDNLVDFDFPSPSASSVGAAGKTVRSRDTRWRCCRCGSEAWTWDTMSRGWRCLDCRGMNYVEINPSVFEQTWANNSTGSSGRLPATAFGPPPSDDGPIHEGSEWDDSEVGTNDPVVDPDTLETMSRRRRRR